MSMKTFFSILKTGTDLGGKAVRMTISADAAKISFDREDKCKHTRIDEDNKHQKAE
tara:strand:- start:142 stop:309 length:168 start_codon:yes stop_codon:yes gene_type:complete